MPKQQHEQAAAIVTELYQGEPVASNLVAKRLNIAPWTGNATRALLRAAQDGLVRRVGRSQWEPLTISEN
jgi:hypothetical protein